MTYEVDPKETLPEPEPILNQWYPEDISECHMVIRGLAKDLAGQVQETERLVKERNELKIALAYFTQTR